jgi:hypothetical protein
MYEYTPECCSTFAMRKSQEDTIRALKVTFENDKSVIFYLGEEPLTEDLKRTLRNGELFEMKSGKKLPYNLSDALDEIHRLNDILKCRDFRLNISYIYDLHNGNAVYSYDFNTRHIIICLFQGDACVSSVILIPTLNENDNNSYITIESRTKPENEGNNLNKLLRAVAIIVAPKISPRFSSVKSQAINPISVYLLISYFHGIITSTRYPYGKNVIDKMNERVLLSNPNGNVNIGMEHAKKLIEKCEQVNIRIPLDEVHHQIANKVFEETAAVVKCNRTTSPTTIINAKKTAKGGRRRSNRRHVRRTKRHSVRKSAKRQTKRRQKK